jgi:uncharacterized protein YndB with AHSA1/START domain
MVSGTKLGVTTYTTPTDTELLITRVFDAPPKVLFDAWTNPKHVPHWFDLAGRGATSGGRATAPRWR